MLKTTVLSVLCLCFALAGSASSSTTTSATPAVTTPAVKSSTAAAPVNQRSSSAKASSQPGVPGNSRATNASPAATQKPQKYDCQTFNCVGKTCYSFTNNTTPCNGTFCVITAFKSGNQISLGGSCASACTDKRDGNNKTHCCQANGCNTKKDEIAKAVDFSGAVFWTVNLLFLIIMQAMAFALNV